MPSRSELGSSPKPERCERSLLADLLRLRPEKQTEDGEAKPEAGEKKKSRGLADQDGVRGSSGREGKHIRRLMLIVQQDERRLSC